MINVYGILIACAILIGALYCNKKAKIYSMPLDIGYDIVLYVVPFAVVFARLYYVLFSFDYYKSNLVAVFRLWDGGLAIYGALLGGALGLYILSKVKKLSFISLLDIVSPVVLFGQAVGRWGNFANKEAHGNLVANASLCFFPFAVNIDGLWYYATFFYESLWNIIGFLLIYASINKIKEKGAVFSLYLLWYAIGRVFIEQLRTDSLMLFDIRISQLLSILIILCVLIFFIFKIKKLRLQSCVLVFSSALNLIAASQNNLLLLGFSLIINYFTFMNIYFNLRRNNAPNNL